MKLSKEYRTQSRHSIDQRVKRIKKMDHAFELPMGWLKSVREALGLSVKMLESRLGHGSGTVIRAEQREREKTITLGTLDSIARAMDCKLVYAFVPLESAETLEAIIEKRAKRLANEVLKEVSHTMKLEAQEVDAKFAVKQQQQLAQTFIENLDVRLWEVQH